MYIVNHNTSYSGRYNRFPTVVLVCEKFTRKSTGGIQIKLLTSFKLNIEYHQRISSFYINSSVNTLFKIKSKIFSICPLKVLASSQLSDLNFTCEEIKSFKVQPETTVFLKFSNSARSKAGREELSVSLTASST